MRIKSESPDWPPDWLPPQQQLHVDTIQWGLGCYEHYLAGGGDAWLEGALSVARHLLEMQQRDGGAQRGGWLHPEPYKHTFRPRPPWISSMAQGEGASLLVRMHTESGEGVFAEAARLALEPLSVAVEDGGVRGELDGNPFPQEYPTQPDSHVLNGAIFTLWGCYDVAVALGDQSARRLFDQGIDALRSSLEDWDTGYWSRYDLFPHPLRNVASSFYHDLHIRQLRAMRLIAPTPEFEATARRWDDYRQSPFNRRRAFASKVLFRLLVPRNRLLANHLPWLRRPA